MPILSNARHELFAQRVAKGMSATEAYKAAGYDTNGHAAENSASRLMSNDEVKARIAELQAITAKEVTLDRADLLRMMLADRELARENKQGSAAIRASELLGKELAGMYVDRKEIGGPGDFARLSDGDLRELAAKEAESLGFHDVAANLRQAESAARPGVTTQH